MGTSLVARTNAYFETTNTPASSQSSCNLSVDETDFTATRLQYKVNMPNTTSGKVYRATVLHLFTPEGTSTSAVDSVKTLWAKGTGGSVVFLPTDGVIIEPPAQDGQVEPVIIMAELKATHTQSTGPTGSSSKYTNAPAAGSADNLFATWLEEEFRVKVNFTPGSITNSIPSGFIHWTAAGVSIADNTTGYTFSWSSTGVKEITVALPACGITKTVRVDVPDVGTLSQSAAAVLIGTPSLLIAAYADEATDYANATFPVGPLRDAFHHSYWMSLSVSQLGIFQWEALLISTGHEHDNRDADHQQAFNSSMDLHNNSIGSTVNHTTLLGTPDTAAIQMELGQAYTNGTLRVWAGGGAQQDSEGILVNSDGSKIYSN